MGGRARRGVKAGGRARTGTARPAQKRSVGGEQVEGRQAVRELLAARTRPARDVWVADGLDPAPVLREISELAKKARVPVRYVARRALEAEARTEGPQGVLAHAQALPEWEFDDLCRERARPPFVRGVRSHGISTKNVDPAAPSDSTQILPSTRRTSSRQM